MSNCNCPENTFAYGVTIADMDVAHGGGATATDERIAQKFGLSLDQVERAPWINNGSHLNNTGTGRPYSVGDILCLPGVSSVIDYRQSCLPDITDIDMALYSELSTLISHAEVLGVAATSDPARVMTPHLFNLQERGGFAEMAVAGIILANTVGYADEEWTATIEHTGLTDFIENMLINPMYFSHKSPMYIQIIDWVTEENRSLSPEGEQLNQIDGETTANFLRRVIDYAKIHDPDNPQILQAERQFTLYEEASTLDSNFPEQVTQMRQSLAVWRPYKETEARLLGNLLAEIEEMRPYDVLVNVSVQDIIEVFERFYENMKNRHDLLSKMDENLADIDFLLMTPEERINETHRAFILSALDDWRSSNYLIGENLNYEACREQDWESFNLCIESSLLGLWNHPDEWTRSELRRLMNVYFFGGSSAGDVEIEQLVYTGQLIAWGDARDPVDVEAQGEEARKNLSKIFFVLGFIPVVGTFLDLVDAVIAISEGRYTDAAVSLFFASLDWNDIVEFAESMTDLNDVAERLLVEIVDESDEYAQLVYRSQEGVEKLKSIQGDDIRLQNNSPIPNPSRQDKKLLSGELFANYPFAIYGNNGRPYPHYEVFMRIHDNIIPLTEGDLVLLRSISNVSLDSMTNQDVIQMINAWRRDELNLVFEILHRNNIHISLLAPENINLIDQNSMCKALNWGNTGACALATSGIARGYIQNGEIVNVDGMHELSQALGFNHGGMDGVSANDIINYWTELASNSDNIYTYIYRSDQLNTAIRAGERASENNFIIAMLSGMSVEEHITIEGVTYVMVESDGGYILKSLNNRNVFYNNNPNPIARTALPNGIDIEQVGVGHTVFIHGGSPNNFVITLDPAGRRIESLSWDYFQDRFLSAISIINREMK